MPKVVLHGELAEKFNPEYTLNIKSPNEAVRALCNLLPGFTDTLKQGSYYVYVMSDEQININEENFNLNIDGDVHIMPEIVGAKKHGLGKVLMGIALVAIAFIPGGQFVSLAAWGAEGAAAGSAAAITATAVELGFHALATIGLSMALGGAAQLLSPKTKNDSATKDQSFLMQGSDVGILNSSAVPLVYGEVLAGVLVVSQEITDAAPTDQTNNNLTTTDPIRYDATTGWWWGGMYWTPNVPGV